MSSEKTIDLSVHNAQVVELNEKINQKTVELNAATEKVTELSSKVEELQEQIKKSEKEAVHKKLFDEGKISKAQLVALNEGKDMLEVLALSEKINDKPAGTSETNPVSEIKLSEKEKSFAKSLGLTEEEYVKYNTEGGN